MRTSGISLALLLLAAPPAAAEEADPALTELVRILRERGVIDDEQYTDLTKKAARREHAQEPRWTDRIDLWGDFRARYESFFYSHNAPGGQKSRHRIRYRLRLNLKGEVNDYSDVFVRLALGSDSRTTNDTLGAPLDFTPNDIFVDKAYVRVSPYAGGRLPGRDGELWFAFGRTEQPWRWNRFKDLLLWDDEISPAGFYGQSRLALSEALEVFGNAGFFVIDENSTAKDPVMGHAQAGFHAKADQRFGFGGRTTWYRLTNLDSSFIARGVDSTGLASATSSAGNISGGLTGNPQGGRADVLEFGGYVNANLIEDWPVVLFGDYARNLDAASASVTNPGGTFGTSDDADAWLVGMDVGDPKRFVRLRVIYGWIEANSFPSQFIDSDLFDGYTNRHGWYWDVSRHLFDNVDANVTAFLCERIHESGGYLNSMPGSDRMRFQANVNYSF